MNKPLEGTDLYPYNTGDYKRSDWTILSFIDNGKIIDENDINFKKWLDIHLTVDKTHACGGPSYECLTQIHSVKNNLNNNILTLGNKWGVTSRIGTEPPHAYHKITQLWVCMEQMRVDDIHCGMPISNWLFNID